MKYGLLLIYLCICSPLFAQFQSVKNTDFVPPLQMVSRVNALTFHYGDTMWVDICVKNVSTETVGFCRNALTRIDVKQKVLRSTRFLTEEQSDWGVMNENVTPQIVWIAAGQKYLMRYMVLVDNSLFMTGKNRMQLYYAYAKIKKKKWCTWGLFDGICYMEKYIRPQMITVE